MGAIYGIVGDADRAELSSMGGRLAHRGRRSAQWSLSPTVHLGLRGTASAVDRLQGANLVFDGAIDNRQALARLLKHASGGSSTPEADGLLLLELISRRGTEVLQDVAGQFAFAYWDAGRGRLLLGRDRIGYAPLYFTVDRGRVVF